VDRPVSCPPALPAAAPAAARPGLAGLASARFYVCLGVLLVPALVLLVLGPTLGLYFRKEAVPLLRPLAEFDRYKLQPRYELDPIPPRPIDEDTLMSLGTRDYVILNIIDRQRAAADRTALANVFITYYTGKPDPVPHVPDECYLAGGFDRDSASYEIKLRVPGIGAPDDELPVRIVQFRSRSASLRNPGQPAEEELLTILYFFHTNNRYVASRNGVRLALGNIWERYAYYAKFEIRFADRLMGRPASLDESREALVPLLQVLVPIILEDHFPDWETLRAAPPEASAAPAQGQ